MKINNKTILITGASSGIGEELAINLYQGGNKIILIARSRDKLERISQFIISHGGSANYYSVDLTNQSSVDKMIRDITNDHGGVDILINNAGFGWYGEFSKMPWDVAQSLLLTNLMAVVKLTHAFLPNMMVKNAGQIINISSIAGDLPIQGAVLYSCSKSFINAFSKALAREVSGTKVQVKLIKPGPVATEFFNRSEEIKGYRIPGEKWAITRERAVDGIIRAMKSHRKVFYIPGYYFFMPAIDLLFGQIIDKLGPILLGVKKKNETTKVVS